ncbi:hypothetical protein ABT063_32780 [Streptomyces sp. NPDC002838]|uniref:hypothetical protein n=1 Tax=Streptomyces sp. NPDC002838 TaxID=3154436 RepID=UPI00332C3F03
MCPIENGEWTVTLLGAHGSAPGSAQASTEGLADFARGARHPLLADFIDRCEPVGPVHLTRRMRWQRRHRTGRTRRRPDAFVVPGDAARTSNPVLAQGMPTAAAAAAALRDEFRGGYGPGAAVVSRRPSTAPLARRGSPAR